jgi:hypothetical protein
MMGAAFVRIFPKPVTFFLLATNNPVVPSLNDWLLIYGCSFPRNWIKGKGYPEGIDRNMTLSKRDKEHVKRLYGPSRLSGSPSGEEGGMEGWRGTERG